MRRALILAIAVLAVGGLAACGESDEEGGGGGGETAASSEPITLSIGIDSVYSSVFLAQTEGLFEEAGLNVEVQQFAQGGEGVDAMVAGTITTAGSADSTVLARAAREDVRALGIFVEDVGNYVKLVVRDEITDPSQIKRMGIVSGSISEYGAFKLLEAEGIDPSTVEMVPAGPPELPALLQRGDIDGFVIWEPWPTRAEEQGGGKVLMDAKEFDVSYVIVLASRADWLESHREEAEKLMEALARAGEMTESQPELAVEAAAEQAQLPEEQVRGAIEDLQFGVRPFTDEDVQKWEEIVDFLMERGLVEQRPDVEQVMSDVVAPSG